MGNHNLELLLDSMFVDPKWWGIQLPPLLKLAPFSKFKEVGARAELFLEDFIGNDFLNQGGNQAHHYLLTERMRRLEDGTYEVLVPKATWNVEGVGEITVPETTVMIEHKRKHHPLASFDISTRFNEYPEKRYEVDFDEESKVKKVVNVDLRKENVATVFSEMVTKVKLPEGWEEKNKEFEKFYEEVMKPHKESTYKLISELSKQGKTPKHIQQAINTRDLPFLEKHKEMLKRIYEMQVIPTAQVNMAIDRLIEEYNSILSPLPIIRRFRQTISLGIDGSERVLSIGNPGPLNEISLNDLSEGGMEDIPFNKKFHDELKAKLAKKPRKLKDYEIKAKHVLAEATSCLHDRHYAVALTRAATAFEIMLSGFLKEDGVPAEEIERSSIAAKMGYFFDKALQKDPAYKGKMHLFDKRIKSKIVDFSDDRTKINDIRNAEIHSGGKEKANSSIHETAHIGCSVYAEAINYILNKGWKDKNKPFFTSEMMIWRTPYLGSSIPSVPENRTIDMMREGLGAVLQYIRKEELDFLRKSIPKDSWAYKKVQEHK